MSVNLTTLPAFVSRLASDELSTLQFQISNSYEMPVSLLTSHISQFQNVLTFASKLIEHEASIRDEFIRESMFAEYLKNVKLEHEKDILRVQADSTRTFSSDLMRANQSASEEISSLRRELRSAQSQIDSLQKDKASDIERECKSLRKTITDLQGELAIKSRAETLIREECRREYEARVILINDKIAIQEAGLQRREGDLKMREDALTIKVQRNASSSFRGQDGEQVFADLASEKMGWVMKYTGDVDHSCDYSTTIQNVPAFVEVKNYTTPVPYKEVTKFISDMKEHPEVTFGIFVSLHTNVQRMQSTSISIDWIHGHQCVMYIQSFNQLDMDSTFLMIEQVAKLAGTIHRNLQQNTGDDAHINYQQRVDNAKAYISAAIARSTRLLTKIRADTIQYKTMIATIETNSIHALSEIKQQTHELTTAIQIMLGEPIGTTDPQSDESQEEVKSTVLTKPKKVKKPVVSSNKPA